ncbi:hypothetical protein VE01_07289 [Pseudogymnoascus verrucosus]|uniref:Centromere protein H C-terminal domain-containing protein n=1 Tax=Pseudogymnoascus verrucosus TaxID=342668 RepID=A0A1B8GFA0_9PEZI|nr:uncharacterized protein VE01_07289 [Pseudogymnoascus verrucosus]OBT94501.2 hypothetical protein VE01_07289 [Pseudogymnoascus verrucosus]
MSAPDIDSTAASGMAGLEITNPDAPQDSFTELQLSELERQILDLYDRLEELQLEIGLLSAPEATQNASTDEVTDEDLQAEQQALLEAKARYALKKSIAESILMANPILKAVHAGSNASPIERDLLPLIQQRDDVSTELAATAAQVLAAREALTAIEAERLVLSRSNTEMAGRMVGLAEQVEGQKKGGITDPEMRGKIEEMEREVRRSRQKWRLMKGVASGVVAGSGMDWARDEKLRALVLEEDSDDE